MRIVPTSLVEYENSLPSNIELERVNNEPHGVYNIKIKTWSGEVFEGLISDEFILKMLENYQSFEGLKKYEIS